MSMAARFRRLMEIPFMEGFLSRFLEMEGASGDTP
jgi:hypothetical protein